MKANKVKTLFQSLLYFLIAMVALLGITFAAVIFVGMLFLMKSKGDMTALENEMMRIVQDSNFNMIVTLICFNIMLLIFGPWYWYSSKKGTKYSVRAAMTSNNLISAVMIGFFTQFAINAVIVVIYLIMPKWMDEYNTMMETAFGADASPFLLLICIVIIGPIAEELLFRGMMYRVLRKGFSFYTAAIISSLLFAVYHMNIVQGIYTFFAGFLLCVLYEKTQTFWYTSIVHIIFNGSSFVLGWITERYGEMSGLYIISLWILSCGIVMYSIRRISVNKSVTDSTEVQ